MLFVPYVPPHRPSARAQELSRRLKETIDQYSILHPDLKTEEIQQAAQLVTPRAVQQKQIVALVIAGAVLLVAALGAVVEKGGSGIDEQFLLPGIILVVGVVLVGVMIVLKSR